MLQLIKLLRLICDSLWAKAQFSSLKLCVGFSIFDFILFLLKLTFLFSKMHGLFNLKTSQLPSKLK